MISKNINIKSLFTYISLFLIVCSFTLRPYITKFFGFASIIIIFQSVAIFFQLLVAINNYKIKKAKTNFIILCIICIIPSLYNNAYLMDGQYSKFLIYIFAIVYACVLYLSSIEKKHIDYFFKLIFIFSVFTSFVTWIGYFIPTIYINKFIPLLPEVSAINVLNDFTKYSANAGFTDHYSRNAFYIVLGIISLLYFFINNKSKKNLFWIMFLVASLYLVGKRGHLVFLAISFMTSYFIFNNINYKTIIKFIFIILVVVSFSYLGVKFVPGVKNVYDRFFVSNKSDISNGRFIMYEDIANQYKENRFIPIGWSQYARSTNYYHPGVHNDYLQLFYETGIIGFILIIGSNTMFLLSSIRYVKKEKNSLGFCVLLFNFFYLTYSVTGIPHYDYEVYLSFFIFNSFIYVYLDKLKMIDETNNIF